MSPIPFSERPTCTISEACAASGIGRTKLYEAISSGAVQIVKVGARTLIVVPSLLAYLTPAKVAA